MQTVYIATKHWGYELWCFVNGEIVKQKYLDYTLPQAKALFRMMLEETYGYKGRIQYVQM